MRAGCLRFNGARERDPAIDAWMKSMPAKWEAWRASGLRRCENAGTRFGSFYMTAVRWHVWGMRPSVTSSIQVACEVAFFHGAAL